MWKIIKKTIYDFALTLFSVFDWRNDKFSCAEKDENTVVYRWLLAAAVLFGIFLRIILFWREPQLSRDAIYYLQVAEIWSKNNFEALLKYDPAFHIPPVMFGFIQFFIRLGLSPLAAGNILNLLAGIVLIPVFYLIARYLFESRKAGVTAAFLTAFNPVLVDYSTNVMRENFMLLFLAAALLGMILGFRREKIWFAASGFFTVFGIFSRYEALEILPQIILTFACFGIFRLFPWRTIFIGSIWFIIGMIIALTLLILLFGIPADYIFGSILQKLNRTF